MRFEDYIQSNETPQDLCREIDELQQKYDELNDFSNSQVKKLLKENEKLKATISKMETAITEIKQQIKPLEDRICSLRRKNASLENKNEKLKKDKEDISRDFMSVYKTNIALNIKLKELLKND